MLDKNLQVIQTGDAAAETGLDGKVNTDDEGLLGEQNAPITSPKMSFEMEGQVLEGQTEIQNGGYIEMTSETMAAKMDSQMQMQMVGEQQMSSFEMNGDGMMIMQSQANGGQQFFTQDGTYMQMTSQELAIDSQSQGFSQQVMIDGQIIQGQQFTGGGSAGEMLTQEMQIQNMGMTEMSMAGSDQYAGQEIQLEGGFILETATGYGETQLLEMSAQGMDGAGAQSQGMMTQEMQLGMNGEMIYMQGMSVEGGGMTMQEMSMGMSGEQGIEIQQLSMENIQSDGAEGVIYLEGGEIAGEQMQMGEMAMGEMSLEMSGQQMQMQEMSLGMQSQEIGFMEGGDMTIQEMSVGMSGEQSIETQQLSMQNIQSDGVEGVIYLEGGEIVGEQIQMGEMAMGEMSLEMNGQQMQMQEMSLGMQSQEIGFLEGGELQMSEATIQEVGFIEGGEIQMSGMSIQEMGIVEGGEIQISEMSMTEMALEMNGGEMQMQEMSMQQMSLETQIQEIGSVEGSSLETEQFQMTEMAIQEIPLDMNSQEIQIQEMSMQEMSMQEMSMEEMSMQVMSIQEMPLEMQEMTTQDMSMQEMSMQEMPLAMQEMTTQEMSMQEMCIQETSMQEMPLEMQEMSMQEMPLEIQKNSVVEVEEIQQEETQLSEMTVKEMSSETQCQEAGFDEGSQIQEQQIQMNEIVTQEMPLEITSQEIADIEGGEIQEEQFSMSEMTIQEMPLDMNQQEIQEIPSDLQGEEISVSTGETTIEEFQLDMTSQESVIQEIPSAEISSIKEEEIQEIPLASEEIVEREVQEEIKLQEAVKLDMTNEVTESTQITSEETTLEIPSETISCTDEVQPQEQPPSETISETQQIPLDTTAIQELPLPVEHNKVIEQGVTSESTWSIEVVGVVETTSQVSEKKPKNVNETAETKGPEQKREAPGKPVTPEINSTVEEVAVGDINRKKEKPQAIEPVRVREIVTEKVSCDHNILIDQFLERISRLEKEKEYIEGRYDELRQEKETALDSREEQFTMREDHHHHCCDIVKDYSTLVEYITSPREDYNDTRSCVHSPTSHVHGAKENQRSSSQMRDDYDYYKSRCEHIKREKERFQKAYETERRQKEDLERDYRNENDEKVYLEERYQEMLDSINGFDETIRSLRRDNELLQKNLNDWASSRVIAQTLEINSMALENGNDGADIAEYKRNIQALEKENREFRTILDVLSKKNESQESLKNIEFSLARENEFIELKRERVRLESSMKEMKRTNKHQQERIEEIRRDSTAEITRLKEKQRKLERSLKESERVIEEKDEEIVNMKKRHSEEIQGVELRLQTDLSSAIQIAKNQVKDLQAKVQRLEEDRNRLREEVKTSGVSGRDRYASIDAEYQDIEVVRQRYEEERRGKMRLANDMKCLLSDIMDLKERNQRLQEDFTRERMEIKGMIEKQANEITQEYLTQINKLQRSLMEETKRRQEAEAGRYGGFTKQDNSTSFISGQKEMNARPSWGNSELQEQLTNEIRQRETLEIENKKLLYKINDILSGEGGGNGHNAEEAFYNRRTEGTPFSQDETKLTARDNKHREVKQKELQSEIEDLQDKLEDMKKEAKKNKDLKRKNEELEEEVTRLTRKRDELLGAQRNLTREVDHLSRTLDEGERRNRKLLDETERFTRKIQDIEESFRQEKVTLARNYENEKARAVEEVTKLKDACEKRLQMQTDTTKALEEKIRYLEEKTLGNAQTQGGGISQTYPSNTDHAYGVSGDSRNQATYLHDDKLKLEIQSLEALLRDVNKKHADELRNLEIQKQRMSDEFQREKQSLERYFEKENESLQKRLRDVEYSTRGVEGKTTTEVVGGGGDKASFSSTGKQSALERGLEDDSQMAPVHHKSSVATTATFKGNPRANDLEKKTQEMQRRFNEEKEEILNRASREKTKLEEEVREAKEKLTSYRRLLEDEMDDLKRKHRKELDYLNDKLLKERTEFEEKLRPYRNGSRPKIGMTETQSRHYSLGENSNTDTEEERLKDQLEKQRVVLTSKFDKDKTQLQNEKKKLMETIHGLTREINALKCEKRDSKNCYKQEIEKLARYHDLEKVTLLERAARKKDEETLRIKEDYEERLSSERKKLQAIIDDFRRKMSLTERKVKDLELQQKNERMRQQEEKMATEKSLIQSREDFKMTMEREYRKMLNDEKQKFERTIKELTKQISFLQDQRKEIQAKLLSNELSGNTRMNTEQVSRGRVIIQMEQEYLERADRERRPMEDKIKNLQQEIGKLKKEKTELKETLENEKQELEEEMEKMQEDMRRKLSKARDEMDRKTDAIGKTMIASQVKNVLVGLHCLR